jgi:hypothetical protein
MGTSVYRPTFSRPTVFILTLCYNGMAGILICCIYGFIVLSLIVLSLKYDYSVIWISGNGSSGDFALSGIQSFAS